ANPSYSSVWGRNGSVDVWNSGVAAGSRNAVKVQPGPYFDASTPASSAATLNPLTIYTKFGYPVALSDYYGTPPSPLPLPSAFGTPPDLNGRYGIGVDYVGQGVFEQHGDWLNVTKPSVNNALLLYNSPYDLNLADPIRRDEPDAGFTTAMVSTVKSGGFV